MTDRVILHAGFHKTGSSHVQRTLRANQRALSPHVTLRLKRDMQPLMKATRSFSALRDVGGMLMIADTFGRLLDGVRDARCLVIAAEELSGHMPGRPPVTDYGAAPILAELYASAIHERWPTAEVTFHYGTRNAQDWLRSAYWEHVKSASMTMDLGDFTAHYSAAADLGDVVQSISDLGLTVRTTPLETATGPFGPAAAVLDLCDLPNDLTLTPQAPHNTRLPDAVLLDLLAANRAYPERTARKAAKAAILAKADI